MVSGRRQAVDSALIKANASLDSLLEKEVIDDVALYAEELNQNSEYKVTRQKKKQVAQHHDWKERHYKDMPGSAYKDGKEGDSGAFIRSKYLSNHTHYSPTDPDARISTKPGKPRNLNYYGQLSVDTSHHVITGALSDFADKRDSQCLQNIVSQMVENLRINELQMGQLLADTGYSSGESLKFCEEHNIDAYIPNFGQYKPERAGFKYNHELNQYECLRGNMATLPFKGTRKRHDEYQFYQYRSSESVCKDCYLRKECCGEKTKFKKIDHSVHKEYYDRMNTKLTDNKVYAQRMSRLRASTVEPVLGTLINFLNMKRINTRGIDLANKHVMMAALTYNLKKYLKFTNRRLITKAIALKVELESAISFCFSVFLLIFYPFPLILCRKEIVCKK